MHHKILIQQSKIFESAVELSQEYGQVCWNKYSSVKKEIIFALKNLYKSSTIPIKGLDQGGIFVGEGHGNSVNEYHLSFSDGVIR